MDYTLSGGKTIVSRDHMTTAIDYKASRKNVTINECSSLALISGDINEHIYLLLIAPLH